MATNDPNVNAALDAVAKKLGITREDALKVVVAKGLETAVPAGAQAYAQGRDVQFGGGAYSPDGQQGKRLAAHELTHVIQQKTREINR